LNTFPANLSNDSQVAKLRVPPHSIEAESSVLAACCWTTAPGTVWGIC
jgi:hypothetical protein